ncbi:MAG: hypothetical protein KDD41_00325 [Flavobacteriales bacterium]|nr:hypothetical protein [Flavobacteriales bacterium]
MKHLHVILILSILGLFACKESDRDQDTSINSCEDFGAAQSYAYDAFKLVHQAALSSKGITAANPAMATTLFGCDTLIVDTSSSPMSITIRFNGSCTYNTDIRTGEIIATFTGKYDNLGTQVSISFNKYTFNDYPVSGSMNYKFQGTISTNPTYAVTIQDFSMENSKNRIMTFSGSQTLSVSSGETTALFNDDTYSISGTASGRAFRGNDYSAMIEENLILKGSCKWVNSGAATVSPENKQPRFLDFGSSCDNKGSAQIYSISYEVVFPE